jgi:hypothetical protein
MSSIQSATRTTATGLLVTVFLAAMSACATQANTASETNTAMNATVETSTAASPEEENQYKKLVCRTIKPTGSRFGERICMYPAQWEKYAGQGRKGLTDIQSKALTTNDPGG